MSFPARLPTSFPVSHRGDIWLLRGFPFLPAFRAGSGIDGGFTAGGGAPMFVLGLVCCSRGGRVARGGDTVPGVCRVVGLSRYCCHPCLIVSCALCLELMRVLEGTNTVIRVRSNGWQLAQCFH